MSTRIIDGLSSPARASAAGQRFGAIAHQLHKEVVAQLDLKEVGRRPRGELEAGLRDMLEDMLEVQQLPLTRDDKGRVIQAVIDEIVGYGPIEPLLHQQGVTDILINGPNLVYIEKGGRLHETDVCFQSDEHLLQLIDKVVSAVGRRVDESVPMVDARLPDGSRFNAIIAPLSLIGPVVSIRRFGANPIGAADLVRLGALPQPVMTFLGHCVEARLNVLVSGGTGSGKTTLLNAMSAFIPTTERIITIEDAAELRLQQKHVIKLETRPPNLEGVGEVTARELVRNALRMRPDRIIVGEIRSGEAIDMLQAMNTGHEGSISTIHANSPRHALGRLQTIVGLTLGNISGAAIREMISDALDLVIQVARLQDGTRRVVAVTEITGIESGVISTQEIFRFKQRTVENGRVRGSFHATGVRPRFAMKLESYGIPIDPDLLALELEV